jgi:hypothetical protein
MKYEAELKDERENDEWWEQYSLHLNSDLYITEKYFRVLWDGFIDEVILSHQYDILRFWSMSTICCL